MEWRSVQELRPRASTSGGQSAGIESVAVEGAVLDAAGPPFIIDVHDLNAAPEVQERHL